MKVSIREFKAIAAEYGFPDDNKMDKFIDVYTDGDGYININQIVAAVYANWKDSPNPREIFSVEDTSLYTIAPGDLITFEYNGKTRVGFVIKLNNYNRPHHNILSGFLLDDLDADHPKTYNIDSIGDVFKLVEIDHSDAVGI